MPTATKGRVLWIDIARTLAITLMVIYHLGFDLQYWYNWNIDVQNGFWWAMGKVSAILFLWLVGVSFVVSSKRRTPCQIQWRTFQRSALILTWAMIITGTTYWLDHTTYIRFGILHCIGVSLLLLLLVQKLGIWNIALGIAWIAATPIVVGHSTSEVLLIIGKTPLNFITLDYYPLFPWTGIVLLGAGMGSVAAQWKQSIGSESSGLTTLLTLPGRHALVAYLAHQPILLGALWLISKF